MSKKAVGYSRVSTLKQVEGHSLSVQKEKIENYCKINNINLVKIYIDEGLSGVKKRPQFEKMMAFAIDNDDVNTVISYDLFRFGRSVDDLRHNIFLLDKKKKKFVSLKENIDISTKMGRLVLTILAAIAEFERETIMERMQAGREWAKTHGTKSGKGFGRPQVEIDWIKVKELRELGLSWNKTAKHMGVSTPTLISRAKEEGID